MAGEIAAAYIALLPSMRGFGSGIVQQGGPQIAMAGKQLGTTGGAALGAAMGGSAAKGAIPAINQVNSAITAAHASNTGWLTQTAQMAFKNVALYGSMFIAINSIKDGISSMIGAMVGFNAELEQSEIGFTTLLGSAAAAKDQMSWIKTFAKETPFGYKDLVNYSQQLIALGFNAETSRQVLEATGDAAAALGRGSESIQRINLALGQMWTKGKVQSQEMLQLTEAGIGAWQILADAYGASVEDVQDAVTRGLIKAQEAVPALVAGMESQFGGLMEKQSETLSGMWSNILDTLEQEFAEAGEPLFRVMTEQAEQFLDALDDPEVVEMIGQLGDSLADGAEALAGFVKFAWEWRDVILAVGIGYTALRLTQSQVNKAFLEGGLVSQLGQWRAMPAALTGTRVAMVQNTQAQTAYQAAVSSSVAAEQTAQAALKNRTIAMTEYQVATERLALVQGQQNASDARSVGSNAAVTAATKALTVAKTEQALAIDAAAVASRNAIAMNQALAASEVRAASATASLTAAQSARAGAMAKLGSIASMGGMLVAAPLLMDGFSRSAKNATAETQDLGQSVLGMAEAVGAGAAAGAVFGSMLPGVGTAVGAVGGAVIGLGTNIWSMASAMDAAERDVTAVKDALVEMGVEARIADLATKGLMNEQLAAVGGFDAVAAAMRAGTYNEFVSGLHDQSVAIHEQIAALEEQAAAIEAANAKTGAPLSDLQNNVGGVGEKWLEVNSEIDRLLGSVSPLDEALKTLGINSDSLGQAQEQIVYTAYEAAYAMDMQTGSLGVMTEAAWQAIIAEGGLGAEAVQAALRMEGLAGTAGYVTQMIAGIPKGTAINFSTNASDISLKIAQLRAAADAGFSNLGMTADGYVRRMQSLQAQYASAVSSATVKMAIPSGGSSSGGGGRGAADAVSEAAQDAARKLEQDRNAQLRFGDAFGTLMESALSGKFDQYRDKLADQIKSLTRDGYTKAADELKRLSTTLTQAALDYGALTNKIKAASDAEADLTSKMRDQYQATFDLVTGLGKVTDAQSFDQLRYLLGETASAATQYQGVLQQLKDEGLSDELWNQLAQAGPESMGLAQSILLQGQAGIDELNSLSGTLVGAADAMGDLVSQSMYQQGADAMQAYIDGLNSQAQALENQLVTIGNNVLTKTAGAITPGNAGYSPITGGTQTTSQTYVSVNVSAESLGDIKTVQDFIRMLESAPTTQLVDAAGKVIS